MTIEAKLSLSGENAPKIGADRIRLLTAIDGSGSISAAAKTVGLSYKAAWDAVHAMNNLFPQPVVASRPGGKHGGGAALTPAGREVVKVFTAVESELSRLFSVVDGRMAEAGAMSTFLWSFVMRTSARNALRCTVKNITPGAVNAEVVLSVSTDTDIVAVITNKSVEDLGLVVGKPAVALIKSSFVILTADEGLKTSARNRLCGTVISRDRGAVNDEIVLDIGDGKTLTAVVTTDSAEALDLGPGSRACALIKASHVILGVE